MKYLLIGIIFVVVIVIITISIYVNNISQVSVSNFFSIRLFEILNFLSTFIMVGFLSSVINRKNRNDEKIKDIIDDDLKKLEDQISTICYIFNEITSIKKSTTNKKVRENSLADCTRKINQAFRNISNYTMIINDNSKRKILSSLFIENCLCLKRIVTDDPFPYFIDNYTQNQIIDFNIISNKLMSEITNIRLSQYK